MQKALKVLLCTLAVAALAAMVFMILNYDREAHTRTARLTALTEQAKEYEAELLRLRRELETQEMHVYKPEGPGAAVIAFRIADAETLEQALNYGTTYGFTPAILINTADEDLNEILETLEGSGLDVILYGNGFDENEPQRVRELRYSIAIAHCKDTRAYLLRAGEDTEENRRLLAEAMVRTLFVYGDTPDSTVQEDGSAQLNYSYVSQNGYSPAYRLSGLARSEQGLLFAFDMKETTVTSRQMGEIIDLICREAENGHIRICSVSEAVQTVQDRVERENERLSAYLSEQEERNARIRELEETIREIYSHWND